eukprot:CAMPEP_0113939396 /NCGR_PEP_ID=MMETSP1339-20121228/5720_1 /TAXON_ID=94617 /ORGANISM="Fibrocapsa japonica" /LENGTH=218 /DNA_ID=CAMNT_0000942895 /DNA_START=106 /DNA_END=762 /DNA_ORIENTATION=+ /assembly_acc=CAM_ASM_000762
MESRKLVHISDLTTRPEFKEVIKHVEKYDVDHDGTMDTDEFLLMIQSSVKAVGKKKFLRRVFVIMTAFVFMLLLANFGLTFAALEMAKDIKVSGDTMKTSDGTTAQTGTTFGMDPFSWESFVSKEPDEYLLMNIFEVSMTDAEIRYEWSGVTVDKQNKSVVLKSKDGYTMSIHLEAKTLEMIDPEGNPVFEYPNSGGGRKLISPNASDQGKANSQSDD